MVSVRRISCGQLTVPAHHASPSLGTLQLFVVRIEPDSGSGDVAADPVVFVGGDLGVAQDYSMLTNQVNGIGREIIALDARGSGRSQPSLLCPEADALPDSPPTVPVDDARTRDELGAALTACRQRLETDGVDLTAFNLAEMAADVDDLRTQLGIDRWNVMAIGTSGRIALEYLRQYGSHVRAAVLDSTEWPGADPHVAGVTATRHAIAELSSACAADTTCSAQTADFAADVDAVAGRLTAHPFVTTIDDEGVRFDGAWFLLWLRQRLSFIRPPGTFVPHAVANFAAGDEPTLIQQIPRLRSSYGLCQGLLPNCWTDHVRSLGTYLSVLCDDVLPFSDDAGLPGVVGDDPGWAEAFGRDPFAASCSTWATESSDPAVAHAVTSDVPTLAIVGMFDPFTTERDATTGLSGFTHAYLVVAPHNGHQVTGTEQSVPGLCIVQARDDWLDRPERPPAAPCTDAVPFDYDLGLDYNL